MSLETLLGVGAYRQRMPRPQDLLPGRDTPLPLHNVHHVHGEAFLITAEIAAERASRTPPDGEGRCVPGLTRGRRSRTRTPRSPPGCGPVRRASPGRNSHGT